MKSKKKMSFNIESIILQLLLWMISLLILVPFYFLLVNTFKTPQEVTASPMGLPRQGISFDSYVIAWKNMNYARVFLNNLINTTGSVILIVLIGAMASYTLARRNNKVNRFIYVLMLSAIMIPFQMTIVPLMKIVTGLHLMNSYLGIILVFVFTNIPFVIFLYYSFIKTIPIQLEEAARIDGASVLKTFWLVCFPLLKPVTGTVIILQSIGFWNDFLVQILFITKPRYFNIARMIYSNVGLFSTDWNALLPMFVLGMLPVLIFYIFMQKSIIKGIAAGSIKG